MPSYRSVSAVAGIRKIVPCDPSQMESNPYVTAAACMSCSEKWPSVVTILALGVAAAVIARPRALPRRTAPARAVQVPESPLSSELFDPNSGTWTKAPPMLQPHANGTDHSAARWHRARRVTQCAMRRIRMTAPCVPMQPSGFRPRASRRCSRGVSARCRRRSTGARLSPR